MKIVFQSRYVNLALFLGHQDEDDESTPDEYVPNTGGSFQPATCSHVEPDDSFGFSPVGA